MSGGNWMFGASSQVDLKSNMPGTAEKRTYHGNRELPANFTEGGLGIGTNENDPVNSRRSAAAAYRQQLDADRNTKSSTGDAIGAGAGQVLPDARKRTAYNYQIPTFGDDEHPLGRSSMGQFGVPPASARGDPAKNAAAEQKRDALQKDRFDIISCLEKATLPDSTPRAQNDRDLLVGMPITGRTDDGMLEIGVTQDAEKAARKASQRVYFDQLQADQVAHPSPNAKKSPRGATGNREYDSMATNNSYAQLQSGVTGFSVGAGPSSDMNPSMKDIAFNAKREAQAAYRAALSKQQQETVYMKAMETAKTGAGAGADEGGELPYMRKN